MACLLMVWPMAATTGPSTGQTGPLLAYGRLSTLVYHLASHQIDAERRSLFSLLLGWHFKWALLIDAVLLYMLVGTLSSDAA